MIGAAVAAMLWIAAVARPDGVVFTAAWLRVLERAMYWIVPYAVLAYGAVRAPWRVLRFAMAAVVCLAVVGCWVAMPVLMLGGAFADPEHGSTRLVALPHRGAQLVLVQTNCGATCDFGLRLDRETPLMPGVVWRRTLWYRYHADTGALTLLPGDSVRVQFRGRGGPIAVVPLPRHR